MNNANLPGLSIKVSVDNQDAERGLDRTKRKVKESGKALDDNAKQWNAWGVAVKAAAVAAAGVAAVKIIQFSDAATSINNKLKLATKSTEDFERVTRTLYNTANETRSSVEATVELYAKMERSTRNLEIGQERLLGVTKSINKAFALSGATTQESSGSIRQLGQALSSGALRGDEFNSIAEQAPIIMEAVSAATGKTAGELRKLAAEGVITSDVLIESLERYADTIDNEFATSTATYSQKMEVATNKAIEFVSNNENIQEAVAAAGDAVVFIAENLDTFADVIAVAGIAITSKFVAPVIASKVALLATSAASIKAASGLGVLTVAANTSRAALTFLGGPVGVLITVAASLAMFVDSESDVEKQAKKTTQAIKDQTIAFKQLSLEEAKKKMSDYGDQVVQSEFKLVELREQLAKLEKKLNQPLAGNKLLGGSSIAFEETRAKAAEVNAEIRKIEQSALIASEGFKKLESIVNNKEQDKKEKIDLDEAADAKNAERLEKLKIAEEKRREVMRQSAHNILNDLRSTYASRQELEDIYHEEQLAKLQEAMDMKRLLGVDDMAVELEHQQIEIELTKAHEAAKTQIEKEESERRKEIARRERVDKINNLQLAGNAMLAINSIFGSKSKEQQKKQRKKEVRINAAAGVARAFAEHDFYSALGISAIIVANAKKQISAINSESSAGISGGGTSAPSQNNSNSQATQNARNKQVDVRFHGQGQLNMDEVRNLIDQINEAQSDGKIINVIGG